MFLEAEDTTNDATAYVQQTTYVELSAPIVPYPLQGYTNAHDRVL